MQIIQLSINATNARISIRAFVAFIYQKMFIIKQFVYKARPN